MSSLVNLCKVCYNTSEVSFNLGGVVCVGCTAFFQRSIKRKKPFICNNDSLACSETAVRDLTAYAACKKCRLDRCYREGMRSARVVSQQQQASVDEAPIGSLEITLQPQQRPFPLLSKMVEALQHANHCISINGRVGPIYGTSETGPHYLYLSVAHYALGARNSFFKMVIDRAPVVGDLPFNLQQQIFGSVMWIYHAIYSTHSNMHFNTNPSRFFRTPNIYYDYDIEKGMAALFTGNRSTLCRSQLDLKTLSREVILHYTYLQHTVQPLALTVLRSEEDMAALLLVSIIVFCQHDSLLGPHLVGLKSLWAELDAYYRATHREPYAWGNLMFMLSAVTAASHQMISFLEMAQLYFKDQLIQRFQNN